MSQASDGKEYWYCINSACSGRNFPPTIPLEAGINFSHCPYCGTCQLQAVSQFHPIPKAAQANVVRWKIKRIHVELKHMLWLECSEKVSIL